MKKLILIFIFCFSVTSFAQRNSASLKLGLFDPGATAGGFIIGYEGGRVIDENFSIGWSVDWFRKNYVDEALVREYNDFDNLAIGTINELRAKTNLHEIPVMFTMRANFPLGYRAYVYLTGGIGAEVLLIWYRNFENPSDDEFKGAFDFSWRIGAGINYELGHRSDLIAELTYHSSEPSWTYEVYDLNTDRRRTFERRFDMSGIMARVGFRFFF